VSIEEAFQLLRDALADILDISNDDETRHICEDALEQTSGVERS
jgi:divalent metal cation (Fe/Co/Zn/Cd) transporter